MRYNNKYFREVLEKDLKEKDLGVNIHCKDDGIHITVPPTPTYTDFVKETPIEAFNIENFIEKIRNLIVNYNIDIQNNQEQFLESITKILNIKYDTTISPKQKVFQTVNKPSLTCDAKLINKLDYQMNKFKKIVEKL